jgi:hypothetical protein
VAGKVVVDCVGLYVVVICIGDAVEYSRFSLGDPSLSSGNGKVECQESPSLGVESSVLHFGVSIELRLVRTVA